MWWFLRSSCLVSDAPGVSMELNAYAALLGAYRRHHANLYGTIPSSLPKIAGGIYNQTKLETRANSSYTFKYQVYAQRVWVYLFSSIAYWL